MADHLQVFTVTFKQFSASWSLNPKTNVTHNLWTVVYLPDFKAFFSKTYVSEVAYKASQSARVRACQTIKYLHFLCIVFISTPFFHIRTRTKKNKESKKWKQEWIQPLFISGPRLSQSIIFTHHMWTRQCIFNLSMLKGDCVHVREVYRAKQMHVESRNASAGNTLSGKYLSMIGVCVRVPLCSLRPVIVIWSLDYWYAGCHCLLRHD